MRKLAELIQLPNQENMTESASKSEQDKCAECHGSGWQEVHQDGIRYRYCNCEIGQFQKQKDEADAISYRKEYADNLVRIANIPRRFASADMQDYDPDYFVDIVRNINLKEGRGLFLWGPVGSGKTHLAAAILGNWLEHNNFENVTMLADGFGKHFLFVQVPDLLDKIRSSYDDRRSDGEDWLEEASEATLIVLDDIGAERVTDWVREKLFQLVNRRYNDMRATIVTSNLSPDQLAAHIGDRTVSRLVGMCKVIKLQGDDRRLKK